MLTILHYNTTLGQAVCPRGVKQLLPHTVLVHKQTKLWKIQEETLWFHVKPQRQTQNHYVAVANNPQVEREESFKIWERLFLLCCQPALQTRARCGNVLNPLYPWPAVYSASLQHSTSTPAGYCQSEDLLYFCLSDVRHDFANQLFLLLYNCAHTHMLLDNKYSMHKHWHTDIETCCRHRLSTLFQSRNNDVCRLVLLDEKCFLLR